MGTSDSDTTVAPKITQNFMGGTGVDNPTRFGHGGGGFGFGFDGFGGPWGGFAHHGEPVWQADRHISDRVCDGVQHLSSQLCGVDQHVSDALAAGFCDTQKLVQNVGQALGSGLQSLSQQLAVGICELKAGQAATNCLIEQTDLKRALSDCEKENTRLSTNGQTNIIINGVLGALAAALGLPIPPIPPPIPMPLRQQPQNA